MPGDSGLYWRRRGQRPDHHRTDGIRPEQITDGISDITFEVGGYEIGTCTVQELSRISGFTIFGHGFGQHTCDIITRFYC